MELPDDVRSADHPLVLRTPTPRGVAHSRGFEAMDLAGDGKTLVTILEGTVAGDPPQQLRVQRYDTTAGKWLPGTLIYELDADTVSVTDMSRIDGNRFVVIERDDLQGDAAQRQARVFHRSRQGGARQTAGRRSWSSTCCPSATRAASPRPSRRGAPFRFPYLTTESIQVLDRKHVVIVNDNNYPATGGRGATVTDATEWIWLELGNPL